MKFECDNKAEANDSKHGVTFENERIMKTMSVEQSVEASKNSEDDVLPEYRFDYSKAKPNRFAVSENQQVIILDADVAKVFANSEQVNSVLRALIATMPKTAAG